MNNILQNRFSVVVGLLSFCVIYGLNGTTAASSASQLKSPSEVQRSTILPTVTPKTIVTPLDSQVYYPSDTPTPYPQYNSSDAVENSYEYVTPTPEQTYYNDPTHTTIPSGIEGNVRLHSDYTGGYIGYDENGNQVRLHPDYSGGYRGQDSYGNQINLNPDYTGGYKMQNGSGTQHCNFNYVDGYNCN